MNSRELKLKQGAAISISTILLVVGFLVIAQMYFTSTENQAMTNSCYDQGGLPVVERSLFSITYFDCQVDL